MKKRSSILSAPKLAGLLLGIFALLSLAWQMHQSGRETSPAVNGAWRLVKTTETFPGPMPEVVKILVDNSFTFATYDRQNKRFLGAGGGTFSAGKSNYAETFEYLTGDSTRVGTILMYSSVLKGNTWTVSFQQEGKKVSQTWQRIDPASGKQGSLAGAWRIRERETEPGKMSEMRPGPRKTIKWLSDSRFQWAAINTETKEFFGTGGGTYTLKDGKYTEHIEFFSRDPRRVGMDVSFDYELKQGAWHHRGQSTAGRKIYEVWARGQ